MLSMDTFVIKTVIGRKNNQTDYDEINTPEHPSLNEAVKAAVLLPGTKDVFDSRGMRVARVHVDGGVDKLA